MGLGRADDIERQIVDVFAILYSSRTEHQGLRDVDLAAYGWVEYDIADLPIIALSSGRSIVRRTVDGRPARIASPARNPRASRPEARTCPPMITTDAAARLAEPVAEGDTSPVGVKSRASRLAKDGRQIVMPPLRKSHRGIERPPFECVALLLQGGGALGAFQAGVYQALAEADLQPDWVAGISIGAINAALIAGNAPEARLDKLHASQRRRYRVQGRARLFHATTAATLSPSAGHDRGHELVRHQAVAEHAGESRRLRPHQSRRNAIQRRRCQHSQRQFHLLRFEHAYDQAGARHRQRGAAARLSPVEVEGELYWDGGLVSNSPLQWVVSGDTRQDTLAFQVDLWNARGEVPSDLGGVLVRQKEIQYSSRTRANTDQFKAIQSVRGALANVLDQVPPDILDNEDGKLLRSVADHRVYQIVHLIYRSKNYEFQSKDYDFSGISMRDHWDAGYNDAVRTLRHPEAVQRPADPTGVATFDVAVDGPG